MMENGCPYFTEKHCPIFIALAVSRRSPKSQLAKHSTSQLLSSFDIKENSVDFPYLARKRGELVNGSRMTSANHFSPLKDPVKSQLFKRALTIFDKTLGVNHPQTILCQQNAA